MENLNQFFVSPGTDIISSIKQMDLAGKKILLVVDEDSRLIGTLTDGDIRRFLIEGGKFDEQIEKVYNDKPIFVRVGTDNDTIREMMLDEENGVSCIPVLDSSDKVADILFWEDLFSEQRKTKQLLDRTMVVINAGGPGTRLRPLTHILPKALIPVGEKPIVEAIMDRFYYRKIHTFVVITHYKGEMIKSYFELVKKPYEVEFVNEEDPLGTIGGLRLLRNRVSEDFFFSYCDAIVDFEPQDALRYHKEKAADITIVSSVYNVTIPYGIIKLDDNGELQGLKEKPEYNFLINTGCYVLNRNVIDLIDPGVKTDFNVFLKKAMAAGKKIAMYPISEKSFVDIGTTEEYKKTIKTIFHE